MHLKTHLLCTLGPNSYTSSNANKHFAACVAYALAWLHHNGVGATAPKDAPGGGFGGDGGDGENNVGEGEEELDGPGFDELGFMSQTEELLERCSARAVEHELHGLAATARLALSIHATREMASPDVIWGSLNKIGSDR